MNDENRVTGTEPHVKIPLKGALFVWACIVVFFITQGLTARFLADDPAAWGFDVWKELLYWLAWLPLIPVAIAVSYRIHFKRGQRLKAVLQHLVAGLLISVAQEAIVYVLNARNNSLPFVVFLIFMAFYRYLLIVAVLYAWRYARLYGDAAARLERARLDRLKTQLRPHFLFNTLNSISVLIEDEPQTARKMIGQLGELLRMAIASGDTQIVSLREELDFTGRYLAIQELRFGNRLKIDVDVAEPAYSATVPHLLLQPLVENAVRHGLSSVQGGHVKLAADLKGETLIVTIADSGAGTPDPGTGVGLNNTRARLESLYGSADLSLNHTDTGSTVTVKIPQGAHV